MDEIEFSLSEKAIQSNYSQWNMQQPEKNFWKLPPWIPQDVRMTEITEPTEDYSLYAFFTKKIHRFTLINACDRRCIATAIE